MAQTTENQESSLEQIALEKKELQEKIKTVEEEIAGYDQEISRLKNKISNDKTTLQNISAKIVDAQAALTTAENTKPNHSGCDRMINGHERTHCINTRNAENEKAKETAKNKLTNLKKEKVNLENTIPTDESNLEKTKEQKLPASEELMKSLKAELLNKQKQYNEKLQKDAKNILFSNDFEDDNHNTEPTANQDEDTVVDTTGDGECNADPETTVIGGIQNADIETVEG